MAQLKFRVVYSYTTEDGIPVRVKTVVSFAGKGEMEWWKKENLEGCDVETWEQIV